MRKYIALTFGALFASTLVFTASNQAQIEKPVPSTVSLDTFNLEDLTSAEILELVAHRPVIVLIVKGSEGYKDLAEISILDLANLDPVILIHDTGEPGFTDLRDLCRIKAAPPLFKDFLTPDTITLDRPVRSFPEWKPWGKVNTKYHSPWLFEPVKIC